MAYRAFLTNLYGLSLTPEAGGLVYTYVRNTSTPLAVATDALGATPATNPVVADSLGQTTFYYSDAVQYTWRATTANGATTLWQADVVGGAVSYTFINDGLIRQFEQTATGTGASQVVTISNVVLTSPYQLLVSIDGIFQPTSAYEVGNNGTNTFVTITAPLSSSIVLRSNAAQGIAGPSGTPADMDGYTTLSGGDGTETHWVRTSGSLNRKVTTNNTPVKATGATTARTLADRFGDEKSIMDFGAVGDGTSHPLSERYASLAAAQAVYSFVTALTQEIDWAALQAGINWAGTNTGHLKCPARSFYINDEVTLASCTTSFGFTGAGPRLTRFLCTNFGQTKKFLKGTNADTDTRTVEDSYIGNFEVGTTNGSGLPRWTDPAAIWLPYDTGTFLFNIHVIGLGNIAFMLNGPNNTRCTGLWAGFGGYHYTNNDAASTGYTYSITSGSTTLNADTGTPFVAGDVGKAIYIGDAGGGNFPLATEITAQAGTSATIADQAQASVSGVRVSWDGIKGAISSGDNTLVIDADILTDADVGRPVFVLGAGASGGILATTIASRTNGTTCELTDAASTTVTAEDTLFTPAFFVGDWTSDDADTRGTNDINFVDCYVEQWQGGDWLFRRGVNVKLLMPKSHGIGDDVTRMGRHCRNFMFDACRGHTIVGGEMDYGATYFGGNIWIGGGFSHVAIHGLVCGALPTNQYVVDLDSTNANTILEWIGGQVWKTAPTAEPGFIRFGSSMSWSNVQGIGPVNRTASGNYINYLPQRMRSLEVIENTDTATKDFGTYRSRGRTGTANDAVRLHRVYMPDDAGTEVEVARQQVQTTGVGAGAMASRYLWSVMTGGALGTELVLSSTSLTPNASGGLALGGTSVPWNGVYANTTGYFIGSTKVVGTQEAAVADASGGATVDTEARAAINALLARLRTHGLIAT